MATEQNIQMSEQTNPVMDTARMTLSVLAGSGVAEAVEYARMLGLEKHLEKYDMEGNKSKVSQFVNQEARFEFLNHLIRKEGRRNIMDIACGFSPRGLRFAREGYTYIGCDLQAAVTAMTPVAEKFAAQENLPGSFTYRMVDITNPDAFAAAADAFDGEITIVCEGLFMYLGHYEVESFIEGVRRILAKHGGCFITPDFAAVPSYSSVLISVVGREAAMKIFEASRRQTSAKSDTNFSASLVGRDDAAAYDFFTQRGVEVERLPYLAAETELNSKALLTGEQYGAVRAALSRVQGWKVVLGENAQVSGGSSASGQFTGSYTRSGGRLNVTIGGRIDSLSAPDFLAMFEAAKQEGPVTDIHLDMKELAYISSAGLRVLMMMRKAVKGAVEAEHISGGVMEILEQTGFDSILDIQ